jgi:hypothetical protein
MMSQWSSVVVAASIAASLGSSSAHAQWSSDSTIHQLVAHGSGEQVQPKIAPTADGGCYISWFTSDSGYDVRLQRLSAEGEPQWGDNGILIADRGYSSTQDYDLDIDLEGFAVLTFRDDRFGGDRITAQRVSPDGSFAWGPHGIQFSDGMTFVASPDIAATTEQHVFIAWASDSETRVARVNFDSSIEWETSISEPGQTTLVASMHGVGNGRVVVSWIQYATFFGQKTLHATMINPDGTEPWASRTAVYDGGSIQFGTFPEFVPNTDGTSTFSWYDTQNSLNVYAQRLAADGTEIFPHNGIAVSTAPRERVSPTATFDPTTNTTYVAWVELTNNQGSQGIYSQALNPAGVRLWGESGAELTPPDSNSSGSINVQIVENNLVTMWIEGGAGIGSDVIHAVRQNNLGGAHWDSMIATDPAYRARLVSTVSDEQIVAAWQIGDFGVADIQAHNLNADGSLGVAASCRSDLNGDGNIDFFDVSILITAYNQMDPIADINLDSIINFFDISTFLFDYNQGCP